MKPRAAGGMGVGVMVFVGAGVSVGGAGVLVGGALSVGVAAAIMGVGVGGSPPSEHADRVSPRAARTASKNDGRARERSARLNFCISRA